MYVGPQHTFKAPNSYQPLISDDYLLTGCQVLDSCAGSQPSHPFAPAAVGVQCIGRRFLLIMIAVQVTALAWNSIVLQQIVHILLMPSSPVHSANSRFSNASHH